MDYLAFARPKRPIEGMAVCYAAFAQDETVVDVLQNI
jgi:hypothetical protein